MKVKKLGPGGSFWGGGKSDGKERKEEKKKKMGKETKLRVSVPNCLWYLAFTLPY